jgi:hypothetical protein
LCMIAGYAPRCKFGPVASARGAPRPRCLALPGRAVGRGLTSRLVRALAGDRDRHRRTRRAQSPRRYARQPQGDPASTIWIGAARARPLPVQEAHHAEQRPHYLSRSLRPPTIHIQRRCAFSRDCFIVRPHRVLLCSARRMNKSLRASVSGTCLR